MAVDKKFFVDINLQGNALNNATIGSNSDMTKGGSFQYASGTGRLEYFDGENVKEVANLSDIAAVTGGLILQGGYNAATNTPNIADENADKGFFWVVTVAGSFLGTSVQVGDSIIAKVDKAGASIGDWLILQGNVVIATDEVEGIVRLATQEEVDGGVEGGAVVLTPATFENSTQLSEIRSDISALETDKLSRDGSQAMEGNLDMGGNDITNINDIAAGSLSGIAGQNINLINNINASNASTIINLPTPISGADAANKTYVDDQAAAAQAAAEATASADATAKADAAQAAAESYADGLAVNYDAAGSAATAETNAKAYADSLAPNYDAAGSAATAQANAEAFATNAADTAQGNAGAYTDSAIAKEVTDRNSAIAIAKGEAIADSESYTDSAISQEVIDRDAAIASAKSEAISTANTYTNNQTTVKFVDTTAWVLDGDFYYATVLHTLGSYVNFTTTMNGGQVVEFAATMGGDNITLFSNTVPSSNVLVLLSKVNNNG